MQYSNWGPWERGRLARILTATVPCLVRAGRPCSRDHFTSTIFKLSMPRSSTIFTAARPWAPASKGNETVPR